MSNNKIYCGIDVGLNGAFSILNGNEVEFFIMPKIGDEYDLQAISDIFCTIKEINAKVIIENVHAIFGSSAGSNWKFGFGAGILEMGLMMQRISFTKVNPKQWQKVAWEGIPIQKKTDGKTDTKKTSLISLKRLFPSLDLRPTLRCKNFHDGAVDSTLLAYFGKVKNL